MAVSSVFVRTGLFVLLAFLGACSSVDEEELFGYGYEEDFSIPPPDMVPVTPDDNPGRTVDEMLNLKPSVTVKKAEYQTSDQPRQVYEHSGRFGSKEKISLRKGLNAPDSEIVYSPRKRRAAEVVRPLELKEQEKDELLAASEEEMLADIVAPKTQKVEMIEVVPASVPEKTELAEKTKESVSSASNEKPVSEPIVPAVQMTPPTEKEPVFEKAATLSEPESPMQPLVPARETLVFEPLVQPEPVVALTPPGETGGIVLTPPETTEGIVLTPPGETGDIVLTPPPGEESESSIELFLE